MTRSERADQLVLATGPCIGDIRHFPPHENNPKDHWVVACIDYDPMTDDYEEALWFQAEARHWVAFHINALL